MESKEGPKLKLDTTLVSRLSFWYDISVSLGLAIKKYKNVKIIGENVRALQRGLTGDRTRIASGYMDEQSLLQAYLLYYWAVSLFEVTMVLEELDARARLPELHSVLDIGSGPGPASFAANVFGARRAFLVDKSQKALATASEIAAEARREHSDFEILTRYANLEEFRVPAGETFDLIVASQSLNEMWHDVPDWLERRRDFVLRLLPSLRAGGILVIIEPSAHYTSIPLLALRDRVLESIGRQEPHEIAAFTGGAQIACAGPCPHSGSCPMRTLKGRPCFSEWQWEAPPLVNELANFAGLDRTSLKAAWVAFKKTPPETGRAEAEGARNMPDTPAKSGSLRGRIVSEPMRNKAGRIRYIVCTDCGLLTTISAPQGDPEARSLGFFQLARGDLLEADGLEARGDAHLGIVRGTRIHITMKAPRHGRRLSS
jgi:SAM-dependent methyltransferase